MPLRFTSNVLVFPILLALNKMTSNESVTFATATLSVTSRLKLSWVLNGAGFVGLSVSVPKVGAAVSRTLTWSVVLVAV